MEQLGVTPHYYIATTHSPADDRARVLKYGRTFFVFDRLGDVQTHGLGEQGLFVEGTRHLSEFKVQLWKTRPLLLSSTVDTSNFLFTADLANLDVSRDHAVAISRGTLHLLRSRFLWKKSCYEEIGLVNHGMAELFVPLRILLDADFADIFEVRGMHRQKKGMILPPKASDQDLTLSYEGLDNKVRRSRVLWDASPVRYSSTELEYEFLLRPKERVSLHLQIECDADEPSASVGFSSALENSRAELDSVGKEFPRMYSPNSRFNDWLSRSVADVQMMMVGNPEANYPYAGVPWFSTVFGRDGIITALQSLWLNPAPARGVLETLAATQATEVDKANEAEPGKIIHELRRGEMAALREVPFGRYYGTVDATPLFIVLAGAYYDRTGDLKFLQHLWPNIERALEWIDRYGDRDHDCFVEYSQQASSGLLQQGWKDSDDSIFHADGSIAKAPIALCEVQGYVYAAKLAAARLSRVFGMVDKAASLEREADELRRRFQEQFWCDDQSTYALALDGDKRPCQVLSSNAGHCLFSGIASQQHARRIADVLLHPDSFSGWGIRTLACKEARYNPLSYHNGSVWPHDNSLIAYGLARYGFKRSAGRVLLALLDLSSMVELRRLPELICGIDRRPGEGPTLYPVACSPQAWAAAAPFLILEGCLGVSVDAGKNRIMFDRPYLPDGIPQLAIEGLRCGPGAVNLLLERRNDSVLVHKTGGSDEIEIVTTTF